MRVRVLGLCIAIVLACACGKSDAPKRELDLDAIKVEGAHLRTDTVGEGQFEEHATFVLVDARNTAAEGAYVTLGGDLVDAAGTAFPLIPQSLWIPAGDSRTFALVDKQRKPRDAKSARAKVRGAVILPAPLVRVEELNTFDDHGHLVLQAYVTNDAARPATAFVIASFHDAAGHPVTRPYNLLKIGGKGQGDPGPGNCPDAHEDTIPLVSKCPVRFIGPPGATTGTIFIGDTVY